MTLSTACWADRRSLQTDSPDCGSNGTYAMGTARLPDYYLAEHCNLQCQNILSVCLSVVSCLSVCLRSIENICSVAGRQCHLLWPPYVIGQAIIFLSCCFFLLSSFFFFLLLSFLLAYSQPSRRLDVHHTSTDGALVANI